MTASSKNFSGDPRGGARLEAGVVAACLGLAALSLLLPSAPGYDAWAWLTWGREVGQGALDTEEGPAWKPLPVVITTLLAPSGAAAPELWLVLARAGALLGLAAAARLARRVSGGSAVAAAAAALGIALVPGWLGSAATGSSEGLLIAIGVMALDRTLAGRHRQALAFGVAAALLRPEVWPFLGVWGGWLAWRHPEHRGALALAGIAVPVLWFGPELWAGGDLLRSAERARVPNPGAPALAGRPVAASLALAGAMAPAPLLAGGLIVLVMAVRRRAPRRAAGAERGAVLCVAGGLAWVGLVALMSEVGFSGEQRYLLPGVALGCVGGAAGLAWAAERLCGALRGVGAGPPCGGWPLGAAVGVLVAVCLGGVAVARASDLATEARRLAYGAALATDLERTVRTAGGSERLRRCGAPVTGPYRGPVVAWRLGVPRSAVGFTARRPGVLLRARLTPGSPLVPAVPAGRPSFALLSRGQRWEIRGACRAPGAQVRVP